MIFDVQYNYRENAYILIPSEEYGEFVFDTANDVNDFLSFFYENPFAAIFAYHCREVMGKERI